MDKQQIEKFRKTLRLIQRELMEHYKSDARCCGISLAQCHALLELGALGRTTISTLANELALDKSTLSRTIDNLVLQGLVLRNINENDRRFMSIELSGKGKEFYKALNKRSHEILYEAFEGITDKKQADLIENLELIVTVLSRIKQKSLLSDIKCCVPLADK